MNNLCLLRRARRVSLTGSPFCSLTQGVGRQSCAAHGQVRGADRLLPRDRCQHGPAGGCLQGGCPGRAVRRRLLKLELVLFPWCCPADAFGQQSVAVASASPAASSRGRQGRKLLPFSSQSVVLTRVSSPALIFPHLAGLAWGMKMCKTSRQAEYVKKMLITNEKPRVSSCRSQH